MNVSSEQSNSVITVQVRFSYVLIVEWLERSGEPRTGEALFANLQRLGINARFVRCKGLLEVWRALVEARKNIDTLGIPAIHIEAHGVERGNDPDEEPRFGDGVKESLRWSEVGGWLAPINEDSDYRLLLVAATCWGQAAIATMTIAHIAPFAVCVGFSTAVNAPSVRASMSELYRGLLLRNEQFPEAIAAAERELFSNTEKIESSIAVVLGYQIVRMLVRKLAEPDEISGMLKRMRARLELDGLVPAKEFVDNFSEKLPAIARTRCQKTWDTWFPPELQRRRASCRLDWAQIDVGE